MDEELGAKWPSPVVIVGQQEGAQTRTLWFGTGVDLQISKPALGTTNAVFPGLRTVIRF